MSTRERKEADAASPRPAKVLVWDLGVRLFHWIVVVGCLADLFVFEEGGAWHRRIGYAVAAALILRAIWGFVGPRHARFADFLPRPSALASYLRDLLRGRERRFLGHNPAGAVMMLLLMVLLAAVSLTGWMLSLDAFFGSEAVEDAHEALANAILLMAGVHAGAALYESWRMRENLVLSMVTGYKRT
jgi:cytochrome b